MLNLLTKTKPWMVASLLVATSLFGQNVASCPKPCPPKPCAKPCPQPCPPTQVCGDQDPCCPAWPTPVLNAAYNYPARIQTRCPWDIYVDVSFIYWQPIQENMELGFSNNNTSTSFMDGSFINFDFDFKPGFEVALGWNYDYDGWDSHLLYTWFHGKHSTRSGVVAPNTQIMAMVGHPGVFSRSNYESVNSNWRLNMDFLDLDLGRSHFVGTKLLFRPAIGARAAWIRQKWNTTYTAGTAFGSTQGTDVINEKTRSWGLGPRATLNTEWIFGEGFRMFGNGGVDILYTRYTTLRETSTFRDSSDAIVHRANPKQSKVGALRTHLDLELGFGWGTYIDCNNWYLDIAAGYGFQVFFNQNMFRHYQEANTTTVAALSNLPNGDLYVQGLTLTVSLDF